MKKTYINSNNSNINTRNNTRNTYHIVAYLSPDKSNEAVITSGDGSRWGYCRALKDATSLGYDFLSEKVNVYNFNEFTWELKDEAADHHDELHLTDIEIRTMYLNYLNTAFKEITGIEHIGFYVTADE